jgi:hypothetical protein
VHRAFMRSRSNPGEDPLATHSIPAIVGAPYDHVVNLGLGDPVHVSSYRVIAEVVTEAGAGAHGLVFVSERGTGSDYVFNVVHDGDRVVFLDGLAGREAVLPEDVDSVWFLPTSDDALVVFAPVFGLVRNGLESATTVADVRLSGLTEAVRFLSGDVRRTLAERVAEVFTRAGRVVGQVDRLQEGLPIGTWVWFTGSSGTGAALAIAAGYRVLRSGEDHTDTLSEREALGAWNGAFSSFVLGWPAGGSEADLSVSVPVRSPSDRDAPAEPTHPGPGAPPDLRPAQKKRARWADEVTADPEPVGAHTEGSRAGQLPSKNRTGNREQHPA